jgi:ACS family hexuronate transporter-like MFS transporter
VPAPHPATWKWSVCGLLLLASAINYMDRQTLANASVRITKELKLSEEQYGTLELGFGWAFAVGALVFGFTADRVSVQWLYPTVLLLWSVMGFATGSAGSYETLLACRTGLGFFEAGHWPCALKTTQRLLSRDERTLGNSVLQSGTSIGAIITPLVMRALMTDVAGSWRLPFQIVGAVGVLWIGVWFAICRRAAWAASEASSANGAAPDAAGGGTSLADAVFSRRFVVLVVLVIGINACWHLFRVWLPKFLQQGRGYSEEASLYFNSIYYVATDVGCIAAGAASLWLVRRGLSVHRARVTVFLVCGAMTALGTVAILLPAGYVMLGVLLIVAMGSLGLFPCYYSFSQELSVKHQGKVSGLLGACAWGTSSPLHKYFGRLVDQTGSYDLGMIIVSWLPLVVGVVLLLSWGHVADVATVGVPASAGGPIPAKAGTPTGTAEAT